MARLGCADTDTVCGGRHDAHRHAVLQHDYLEGPLGYVLLVYVLAGRGADRRYDDALASGHHAHGGGLHDAQRSVARRVALLRAPSHGLRPAHVPARRDAVRSCRRRRDERRPLRYALYQQPLAAARHAFRARRSALLCGDEGGKGEDTGGVRGICTPQTRIEQSVMVLQQCGNAITAAW